MPKEEDTHLNGKVHDSLFRFTLSFWEQTIITVSHILNRVNTTAKKLTLFEYLTRDKPDLSNFRDWSCKAHVLIRKPLDLNWVVNLIV